MKNNTRLNDALQELADALVKNLGGNGYEIFSIINSWAQNNIEIYSIKNEVVKDIPYEFEYRKRIEETAFIKIAHELGKTCGVTRDKGHQYRPEWKDSPFKKYVEEFETSIYCLRRTPRN